MKIYSYVKYSWNAEKQVYELTDSIGKHYKGDIALCCGGGGSGAPAYPEPTPQEKELLDLQLQYLKDMGADMELMRPFVLQSIGMMEDEQGDLRKMTDDEYYASLGELEKGQYDLTKLSQERLAKAYAGELDVSPALEKKLVQSESQMEEALSQKLGPDWATTTSGMQAKAQFTESAELIREEARTGVITGGTGAALANLQTMTGLQAGEYGEKASFPMQSGGLFGAAGQMTGQMSHERAQRSQYGMGIYSGQMQRQAGLMSGWGSVIGAGIMAGGYAL